MKKHSKGMKQAATSEAIGIDLGNKLSRYCILNEAGEGVEKGWFRKSAEFLGGAVRGWVRVALEVGAQWAWTNEGFAGTPVTSHFSDC